MKLKLFLSKLLLVVLSISLALPAPAFINIVHADDEEGDSLEGLTVDHNADIAPADSSRFASKILRTASQRNKDMALFFAEKLGCPNIPQIMENEANGASIAPVQTRTTTEKPKKDLEIDEDMAEFSPILQNLRIQSLSDNVLQAKAAEIAELNAESYHEVVLMLLGCLEAVPQAQEPITKIINYISGEIEGERERNQSWGGFEGKTGYVHATLFILTIAYGGYKLGRLIKGFRTTKSVGALASEANIAVATAEREAEKNIFRKMIKGVKNLPSRAMQIFKRTPRASAPALIAAPAATTAPAVVAPQASATPISTIDDLAKHYSLKTEAAIQAEIDAVTAPIDRRLRELLAEQNKLLEEGNTAAARAVKQQMDAILMEPALTKPYYKYTIRATSEVKTAQSIEQGKEKFFTDFTFDRQIITDRVRIADIIKRSNHSDEALGNLYEKANLELGITAPTPAAQITANNAQTPTASTNNTPVEPKPSRFKSAAKLGFNIGVIGYDYFLLSRWWGHREYEKKSDPRSLLKAVQVRMLLKLNKTAYETASLLDVFQHDIELIAKTNASEQKNNADLIEAVNKILNEPSYQALVNNGYYEKFTVEEKTKENGKEYVTSFINSMKANNTRIQNILNSFKISAINVLDLKELQTQMLEKSGLSRELVDEYMEDVKNTQAKSLSAEPVLLNLGEANLIMEELQETLEGME